MLGMKHLSATFLGFLLSTTLFAGWGYEYATLVPHPAVWFAPLDAGVAQTLWAPAVSPATRGWEATSAAWLGGTYLGSFHAGFQNKQLHLTGLFSGSMDQTDAFGRVTGTFSTQHLYLGLTSQRPWRPGLTLGFGLAAYVQNIATYTSIALGGQIGLLWKAPTAPLQVAATLGNLGFEVKPMDQERFHPAPQLRVLAQYALSPQTTLAAGTVLSPAGSWLQVAGTYQLTPLLRLALAYTTQWNALKIGDPNDFLIGLMPGLELHWRRFRLSYAYAPLAAVGDLHLVSLSLQ